jgi:hypothetical protein
MYQDYKDLLSAFNAHGVRYLIVGGYAVIFHAQPRFTKDIDIFIKADLATHRQPMRRLPGLAHRSQAFARRNSPIAAASFVLDTIHRASIFCPTSRASISMQHGNAGLKEYSISILNETTTVAATLCYDRFLARYRPSLGTHSSKISATGRALVG